MTNLRWRWADRFILDINQLAILHLMSLQHTAVLNDAIIYPHLPQHHPTIPGHAKNTNPTEPGGATNISIMESWQVPKRLACLHFTDPTIHNSTNCLTTCTKGNRQVCHIDPRFVSVGNKVVVFHSNVAKPLR